MKEQIMKNNKQLFLALYKKIENKEMDILLFDIFDTIILRKVHPEYVKKIFSKKLKEYYSLQLSSDEIYKIRFEMEASICKKNEQDGFDLEFSFHILCQYLYEVLNKRQLLYNIAYEEFYNNCKAFEIEAELDTQEIDQEIIELAKMAKSKGIVVCCLSDFYLSKEMIQAIFKKHKIDEYFSDIIVSSEYLITKRSGRLYEMILKDFFLNKKVAMIGDNEHSDYKMARKYKIESFLVDRKEQREFYQTHLETVASQKQFHSKIQAIIDKKYISDENIFFKEMSFTLYYFIYLLYLELVSKEIKNIFFLSREGEFLKRIFDTFMDINGFKNINTHYLIVSRKATFVPSLNSLENESFETLFRQYRKMSIQNFLQSLNFLDSEISKVRDDINLNIDKLEDDLPTSEVFKLLLNNKVFQMIYEKKRVTQKENIKKYIESFDSDIYTNGLAIVDAGWKGTIQDHIFKIFDQIVPVTGFYIGLVADLMPKEYNVKKGLVFDFKNFNRYDKVFKENMTIFEVLLGASHGSADNYIENKQNIVEPITYQEVKEKEIFEQVIKPIQEVLYLVFKNISNEFVLSHMSIFDMRHEVAIVHARMIYSPTQKEISFFRKLYHFENFGLFEFSTFNKYKTETKKDQIKHILNLIKNPKKFFDSTFWKAAALDDVGLLRVYLLYGFYQKMKIFSGKKWGRL